MVAILTPIGEGLDQILVCATTEVWFVQVNTVAVAVELQLWSWTVSEECSQNVLNSADQTGCGALTTWPQRAGSRGRTAG